MNISNHEGFALRLRQSTAMEHKNIESCMPVMSENFQIDSYKNLLIKFYGFYFSFEREVAKTGREVNESDFDLERRMKLALLEKDLRELGLSTEDLRKIEKCELPLEISSLPRLVGAMYVTEGSTLGGQIITKHLKQKFSQQNLSFHFFNAYGTETGLHWRRFIHWLEASASESTFNEISDSAKLIFTQMRSWLGPQKDSQ